MKAKYIYAFQKQWLELMEKVYALKNQIAVKRSYPNAQRNNRQYHKEGYKHSNTL